MCVILGSAFLFYPNPLFYIPGLSFIFVGISDDYLGKKTIWWIHYVFSVLGILSLLFILGWQYLLVFFIFSIPLVFVKNSLWWIEVLAFIIASFGIFRYFYFLSIA